MNERDEIEGNWPSMTQIQPRAVTILETVPDEILHDIFLHVATEHPRRNKDNLPISGPHPLLPVVQVNRRFNTVASPLLVRNWHLRSADQSGAKSVLHLLKHPELRSQVKSLALYEESFDEEALAYALTGRARHRDNSRARRASRDRWPQTFCSTVELEQLAQSAEETYPALSSWAHDGEEHSWADEIRQRSSHAIAALALAWATELQELELMVGTYTPEVPDLWTLRLVGMIVGLLSPLGAQGRSLPPPVLFTKLRCVTLGHCTYTFPSFLHLPPYKCLEFESLGPIRTANTFRLVSGIFA